MVIASLSMENTQAKSIKHLNKSTFLDSMIENSRIACILILDKEGIILEMSHGVEEQLGYNLTDLQGKNFSVLFTEEDRMLNKPAKELQEAKEKGFAIDNNYIIHKNGKYIWCQGESNSVNDKGEQYFVKYIYDINKQKELEKSLIEAKKFSESITETISNPLIVLDSNLSILMANNSFHKIFNSHQIDIHKKPFFELESFHLNIDRLRELLEKILPESSKVENFEIELNLPNGQKFFQLNAQQIIEEGHKMQKILISFHDITEEKRIKGNLNWKNEQLNKVNKDLDTFVYTASHDLKAPLSNIEGLINLMEENPGNPEEIYGIIKMMRESINKFKNTINDLTTIAKAEQEGDRNIASLEFSKLVEEIKFNLKEQIEKSNAYITEDFSEASTIFFSPKNLRSILQNLVSNALKYHSPDRRPAIIITTKRVNDYILLQVSDNGLGIKEEDKSKVFEMYKRLHDHVEGTGVGLGIVARIVNNNGGKIEIESEVGKGTTFKVYLKV